MHYEQQNNCYFDLAGRRNKTLPVRQFNQKTTRRHNKIKIYLNKLPNDFFGNSNPDTVKIVKLIGNLQTEKSQNAVSEQQINELKKYVNSQQIFQQFRETSFFDHHFLQNKVDPVQKEESPKDRKRVNRSEQRKRNSIKNIFIGSIDQTAVKDQQNQKDSFMNCTFNKKFYSEQLPPSPKNVKSNSQQHKPSQPVQLAASQRKLTTKKKQLPVNTFTQERINFMNKLEKHQYINSLLSKKIMAVVAVVEVIDQKKINWKKKYYSYFTHLPYIQSARRYY